MTEPQATALRRQITAVYAERITVEIIAAGHGRSAQRGSALRLTLCRPGQQRRRLTVLRQEQWEAVQAMWSLLLEEDQEESL